MNHLKAAQEFGRQLIVTQDLDPVYCAIVGGVKDWNQRARLVLAYSCLYHLGASAYISEHEGKAFWKLLMKAAVNKDGSWPRGTERRHWRATNAVASANYFIKEFSKPEDVIDYWTRGDPTNTTFKAVASRVQETPSFGPWIAFNLVDMAERVLETTIDLSGCDLAFYDEPRKGAALILCDNEDEMLQPRAVQKAVQKLLRPIKHLIAPPGGRELGIMEAETILCKYKAHVHGHYYIGKDCKEVRHALEGRWSCTTSQRLLKAMPLLVKPYEDEYPDPLDGGPLL